MRAEIFLFLPPGSFRRLTLPIHHRGRGGLEVGPEQTLRLGGNISLFQRSAHHLKPVLSRDVVDGKRCMPHSKPRVASLLDVALRTAEAKNEKVPQALFRSGKIVGRIQAPKHRIVRDLVVEGGNQLFETILADYRIDFMFFHGPILTSALFRFGPALRPFHLRHFLVAAQFGGHLFHQFVLALAGFYFRAQKHIFRFADVLAPQLS
jgi:hypothetical protein